MVKEGGCYLDAVKDILGVEDTCFTENDFDEVTEEQLVRE